MNPTELLARYLDERSTMQIASVAEGQPWICTVRFVADKHHTIYWASLPSRRHSQEIAQQPQVAAAIVVHDVIDEPVIGIQIEGNASMQLPSPAHRPIVEKYATVFKRDQQWVDDFVNGRTEHRLYKLTPSNIYLFDEKHLQLGQRIKVM